LFFLNVLVLGCAHCKALRPSFEEIAEYFSDMTDGVKFFSMDVSLNDFPSPFNIFDRVPQIIFIEKGQLEILSEPGGQIMLRRLQTHRNPRKAVGPLIKEISELIGLNQPSEDTPEEPVQPTQAQEEDDESVQIVDFKDEL
jgi:thiol-disulfide isomerase/thioredoxin